MFKGINKFMDLLFFRSAKVLMFVALGVLQVAFLLDMINGFLINTGTGVAKLFEFVILSGLLTLFLIGAATKKEKVQLFSFLAFIASFISFQLYGVGGEAGLLALNGGAIVIVYWVFALLTWLVALGAVVLIGLAYGFGFKRLLGIANFLILIFTLFAIVEYVLAIVTGAKIINGYKQWTLFVNPLLLGFGFLFVVFAQYQFMPKGFSGNAKKVMKIKIVEDEDVVEMDEVPLEEPKEEKKPAPKRKKPEPAPEPQEEVPEEKKEE